MSSGPAVDMTVWSSAAIEKLVGLLALLLPSLDRFTQASWLTHPTGEAPPLGDIALQTVIYSMVLIGVGLVDFYRREY